LLLLGGLAGVGIWGWSRIHLALSQKEADKVLERSLATRPAIPKPTPKAPPPLPEGTLLGRIVIPRLKMQTVVREGAGTETLDVAAGHIPGTALPGQTGNVGVAGHRDTLFRGLRNIAKNDLIEFETPTGSYNYEVESTRIVKPQDVEVLESNGHAEITLVTCYPFNYVGSAPNRFIVKARLANTPEQVAQVPPAPPVAPAQPQPEPPPAKKAEAPRVKRAIEPVRRKPPPVMRASVSKRPRSATRKVSFRVGESHSTQLAPGILLGVSRADAVRDRASGWLWVGRARHTIWLRNQPARQPLLFHSNDDSRRAELMITKVSRNAVSGYLLLFGDTHD